MKSAVAGVVAVVACAGIVTFVLARLEKPPAGPVEPAWDRETCSYCRMHVGERAFAAQLQTRAGEVLFFDDPGCLLRWRSENPGRSGEAYFHHLEEDRWLEEDETGFVAVEASPMAWGLGALELDAPGAISVSEAARELSRRAGETAPDPDRAPETEADGAP